MKDLLYRTACVESLENRTLLSSYFVATSGSDSAAGSTSAPWQTLQKAADTAKAGDTITVRAGTYVGMTLTGSAYPGGTSSAPITFIAGDGSGAGNWQTSGVTINGFSAKDNGGNYAFINIEANNGYYVIEGFNVMDNGGATQKAGIRVANSHNDKILNNQVSGAYTGIFASLADGIVIQGNSSHDAYSQHGIYVNGTNGYTVRNNECYNNNWDGIHLNVLDGGNTINTNGLVEGNSVHDNLLSGMDVTGASYVTFDNNIAYGNGKHGVVLQNTNTNATPACTNNTFINNTFDASNGMYGIEVTSGNGNNTTVFNNILLGSSSYGAIGGSTLPSSLKMSNNITSGSTSSLFANAGAGDYHLKSGSVAIDAGTGSFNGVSAPSTDKDGNARPQGNNYDIGAYESGSSSTVTVPAAPTTLSAAAASTIRINLSWTDNSTNETGYKIDRATGTGAYASLATLAAGVKSYGDSGLAAGTQYSYRVYAYNSAGNSSYSNVASATTVAVTSGWQNHAITSQTGSFTVQFDAVPTANGEDAVIGLSSGAASDYTNLAAIVRFNSTGTIDARNGANYVAATSVGYAAGTSYHFRMVVNVATHTYSVYVTPQGGSETLLGSSYAFRSEQAAVSTLNNWAQCALVGDTTVSNFVAASTNTTPPTITTANFVYQVSPNQLSVTFSKDVSASLSKSSLRVVNLVGGAAVSVTAYSYNSATNTATFSLAKGLPDGNYRATLGAATVSDAAGNHLAADFTYAFFVLAGDVNHDGIVNTADLTILAANWQGSGKVFSQGDLNNNGIVDSADLAILALNWQKSLPA